MNEQARKMCSVFYSMEKHIWVVIPNNLWVQHFTYWMDRLFTIISLSCTIIPRPDQWQQTLHGPQFFFGRFTIPKNSLTLTNHSLGIRIITTNPKPSYNIPEMAIHHLFCPKKKCTVADNLIIADINNPCCLKSRDFTNTLDTKLHFPIDSLYRMIII